MHLCLRLGEDRYPLPPLERPRYLRGAYIMNHKKLLLTLTLCLCALLCMAVTASASEVQEHSHPVCGKTHTDIGDHTGPCGDVTWTAWNGPAANGDTNITYDSNNTAYIYLADNVTTKYSIKVREGKTLYLCLNGKSITKSSADTNLTGNRAVIDFTEGGSLILCDCQDTGSITHTEGVTGRGVNVGGRNEGNGTFIMYGGAISGNNCVYGDGGGVYVYGTFTMYGAVPSKKINRPVLMAVAVWMQIAAHLPCTAALLPVTKLLTDGAAASL